MGNSCTSSSIQPVSRSFHHLAPRSSQDTQLHHASSQGHYSKFENETEKHTESAEKTKQKDISGSSWSEGHLDVYAWSPEVSSDSSCEGGGGNIGAGGALDFRDTRTLAHGLLWPGPGWRLAFGMHYFFGWWLCTNCTICATVCGGSWGGTKCESTASAAERFATLCLIFCSLQWGAFMSVRSSVCVLVCMYLTDQVSTRTYTPKILLWKLLVKCSYENFVVFAALEWHIMLHVVDRELNHALRSSICMHGPLESCPSSLLCCNVGDMLKGYAGCKFLNKNIYVFDIYGSLWHLGLSMLKFLNILSKVQ